MVRLQPVILTVGRNGQGMTATQYSKVTEMIKAYAGKANNFKSGIVFDEDPEFGDRVNITIIVTGINTVMAQPQTDLGNIVIIEPDFEFHKGEFSSEGVELPEVRMQKIGYNNKMLRKKNLFENGQKPALIIREGENKSRLENIAAIRRKAQGSANNEK